MTGKPTMVKERIEFELSQMEMANYGAQLAEIDGRILEIEEARAQAKKNFKSQLTLLEQQKQMLSFVIRRGKELREVDVAMVPDYGAKEMVYYLGATVVKRRPMTEEELQMKIDDVMPPVEELPIGEPPTREADPHVGL